MFCTAKSAAAATLKVFVLRYRKETEFLLYYHTQSILMVNEKQKTILSPEHLLNKERVLRICPASTIENNTNKLKLCDKAVCIAIWNVQNLFMAGKLANVEMEMCRLKFINSFNSSLNTVKLDGLAQDNKKPVNNKIYFSGETDPRHQCVVAILMPSEIANSVLDSIPLSDYVIRIWKISTTQ